MAFSNPITGGQGALVRPAIKSPNYAPGVAGWSINRDGTAEFNDVVIRGELESVNYVPGVSGWHLDPNGSAEFYDITARGDIIAEELITNGGVRPFFRAHTINIPLDPEFGWTYFSWYTNAVLDETEPYQLHVHGDDSGEEPRLTLISAALDSGGDLRISMTMQAPCGPAPSGSITFGGQGPDGVTGDYTQFTLDKHDFALLAGTFRIVPGTGVSPSSTTHPFQIGSSTGVNVRMDGDEIQFANNGVAAAGKINESGGDIAFGGGISTVGTVDPGDVTSDHTFDGNTRTTTSTTYVSGSTSATITMPYPSSGSVFIAWMAQLDNTLAGETCSVSVEVRDDNAAGTQRVAPSDNYRLYLSGTTADQKSAQRLIQGLPTTGTMFVRVMIRSSAVGNTASMNNTEIAAMPVL